jgi:hypothetical protein
MNLARHSRNQTMRMPWCFAVLPGGLGAPLREICNPSSDHAYRPPHQMPGAAFYYVSPKAAKLAKKGPVTGGMMFRGIFAECSKNGPQGTAPNSGAAVRAESTRVLDRCRGSGAAGCAVLLSAALVLRPTWRRGYSASFAPPHPAESQLDTASHFCSAFSP